MKTTVIKLTIIMACIAMTGCALSSQSQQQQSSHTATMNNATVMNSDGTLPGKPYQGNNPNMMAANSELPQDGGPIGGSARHSMDEMDLAKLSHALDKAPGKSSHWVNQNTGTAYTVVPTHVVKINGNPYCRRYNITAVNGDRTRETSGTACVMANGSWKSV